MDEEHLSEFQKTTLDFYRRWENTTRYLCVMLTIAVLLQFLERIC